MEVGTDAEKRLEGCIWGMLVGDAYCLGSHWIYDRDAFAARFPTGPSGFDAPAIDHYHAGKPAGGLTHYGEGGLLLLQRLAAHGADSDAYGQALVAFYAPEACTSYRDRPTRHLLEARATLDAHAPYAQGADDAQNITTSRLAPLVALLAGDPRLMLQVDAFTRVLQQNDHAVAYACVHARLLEHLLAGSTLDGALDMALVNLDRRTEAGQQIAEGIDKARAARAEPVTEVAERFGLSCPLSKAFPAALQAALKHETDYAAAIEATCTARGDNASRAMLVGSWLGARHGIDAVPEAWRRTVVDHDSIEAAINRVLERRRSRTPSTMAH